MKIEIEYNGKKRTFLADDANIFDQWITIGEHTEIVEETVYKNGVLQPKEKRINRDKIMFNTGLVESISMKKE